MPMQAQVERNPETILMSLSPEEKHVFLLAGLRALEQERRTPQAGGRPEFLDLNIALNEDIELDWIIPGLILRGTVNFLVGAGGRGKSLLSLFLAAELASGSPEGFFSSELDSPQKVLAINAEDPKDIIHHRIRRFIAGSFPPEGLRENLLIWPAHGDLGPLFSSGLSGVKPTDHFKRLTNVITAEAPRLVILDPLMRLLGLPENDNTLAGAAIMELERVAKECGFSWLIVHHTGKAYRNEQSDIAARGASGFVDAARCVMVAVPPEGKEIELLIGPREGSVAIKIIFTKISYGPLRNPVLFVFTSGERYSHNELDPEVLKRLNLRDRILRLLSKGEPLTFNKLKDRLRADPEDLEVVLEDLIRQGAVVKETSSRAIKYSLS